jgi:hypothetical protein
MTTLRGQAGLLVPAVDAIRGKPLAKADSHAQPAAGTAGAWRVRFVRQPGSGEQVFREFQDPESVVAVVAMTDAEEMLLTTAEPGVDEFHCLVVPATGDGSGEWGGRALEWVGPAETGAAPTVDVTLRNDRILWRAGRAAVIGSRERAEEILPGLVEFAWYEGQLRRLESEIQADWQRAEQDVPLTHRVRAADLKRCETVDRMTEVVTHRRMRFARLEPHLGKAPLTLSPPARRVFSELLQAADVADRLDAVDDRLEVTEDLYELANDRLLEFSYYRSEFWLEVGIIVILILELAGIGWELWAAHSGD